MTSIAPPSSFASPTEARAYALALTLARHLGGGWELVQPHLSVAIAARPDAAYVECLLDAVESLAATA